jgi:hypothetical protein
MQIASFDPRSNLRPDHAEQCSFANWLNQPDVRRIDIPVHRRIGNNLKPQLQLGMNPAFEHLPCTRWPDEAQLLHFLFQRILPESAEIEVSRADRGLGPELRRRAAHKDGPLEAALVHPLADPREQPQRSFESGR